MTFASSFLLLCSLALATGCASSAARPAQNAAPGAPLQKQAQTVELRHIYLLSPGPNSTLVVTRSDVGAPAQ
ncbi:MAG: hypothetical protein ABUL62_19020 [Myxococcales bacterium]